MQINHFKLHLYGYPQLKFLTFYVTSFEKQKYLETNKYQLKKSFNEFHIGKGETHLS